ncbi:PH domain-containing protein [Neobacillus sp. LXY-4]|uniref:PH domain-containing protein n=1 Tax=Neobacillus sp. LXY-4 TaxID=3379826 RepID=UPI003EE3C131
MKFRSKTDSFFVVIISITLLVILTVLIIPLFLDKERTSIDIFTVLSLCILSIGFVLWSVFSIKYVFEQDHLFIKGGLFKSKIPYDEITGLAPTKDIFTGYRLLSSKDALEVFYKSASFGSVKITPKNRELFISELKKRCPKV